MTKKDKNPIGPMHKVPKNNNPLVSGFPPLGMNDFMIEFGEKNEDYGGMLVFYMGGCPRRVGDVVQTYRPDRIAELICKSPAMEKKIKKLEREIKKLKSVK